MNAYAQAIAHNLAVSAVAAFCVWWTGSLWGLLPLLYLQIPHSQPPEAD